MLEPYVSTEDWASTGDGFSLCTKCLAEILLPMGIRHTGLSDSNPADVESFYDDWYLYRIERDGVCFGLVKMREQERDYFPGYADGDDPGVTISFVGFPVEKLERLGEKENRTRENLLAFVDAFRNVTERRRQRHEPGIQRYFSDVRSRGAYLIADAYLKKLMEKVQNGQLPLPDRMCRPPRRIRKGMEALNAVAGRTVCDFDRKCLHIADPSNLSREEACCVLAAHTGSLNVHSFAAEVRFHSDALISPAARIPVIGHAIWYESAIRADMQIEPEKWLEAVLGLKPYHRLNGALVRCQQRIHADP